MQGIRGSELKEHTSVCDFCSNTEGNVADRNLAMLLKEL